MTQRKQTVASTLARGPKSGPWGGPKTSPPSKAEKKYVPWRSLVSVRTVLSGRGRLNQVVSFRPPTVPVVPPILSVLRSTSIESESPTDHIVPPFLDHCYILHTLSSRTNQATEHEHRIRDAELNEATDTRGRRDRTRRREGLPKTSWGSVLTHRKPRRNTPETLPHGTRK